MHSYSSLPQIATQMTTQQTHHIDFYRVFTQILFMRSGFTAYFVLSPVNGSFATVAAKACSCEFDASTAASGPHDFAVRFTPHSSEMASASTASHRTFVTMANAPHLPRDARS